MNRSPITTHILDLATGRPASGVRVELSRRDGEAWQHRGTGETDGPHLLRLWLPALSDQLLHGWHLLFRLSSRRTPTRHPGIGVLTNENRHGCEAQQSRSL